MNIINPVIRTINAKLSNQFVRNLGWLGMAQIAYRVLRLGLVVIIARFLTPYDYGLGAIVLTVREFAITFSNIGIGAKLIQAEESELKDLSNSAYWLNWFVFSGLFILQCIAAFPISWIQNTQDVILPICVAGISYLIWPLSSLQKLLLQRENRFKVIAIADSLQFSISTILSAILAVMGMGVWAFALPAVLVAPLEVLIYRRQHSWRLSTGFTTKYWKEIWNFGRNILAVSLLKTLRNNLDYWIILGFLGVEELGIYFFGFNAGLGISLSIISAIESAILPHLCASRTDWGEFRKSYLKSLKVISFIIIPFVLLQSSLAPFYIPIIFGQKWIPAIPIVVLICLSAIPRPFADAASQLLVAIGKPHLDLRWNVFFTTMFAAALLLGIQWKVLGVATAVLLIHVIFLPLFTLWASRYVFKKRSE
ncbi:MAG: lipopolysaccharide biosynthesis protein [Scytonema sp. PMC 1069.18]|nr:lipopolysaccharide biosynthesis protein [Scytonema sp. PMC 1069.18]MEC4884323.1 lipopolysaccharide biosynthesis protein [Scytonema sp. PMC 1070.18]